MSSYVAVGDRLCPNDLFEELTGYTPTEVIVTEIDGEQWVWVDADGMPSVLDMATAKQLKVAYNEQW